jgi:glycosyltransferase involved in cell wall biosynthesis
MNLSVDVVIPCFNGASFVERAVDSVLQQTYPATTIIVVNDGSEDESNEIINKLAQDHPQIFVVNQVNLGLSAARNNGLSFSKSDLVAFLDVDDYWLPNKIESQVREILKEDKAVAVASGYLEDINGTTRPGLKPRRRVRINPKNLFLQIAFLPGSASSILIRRQSIQYTGSDMFDTRLSFAEDLESWIRLSEIGPIRLCNEVGTVIHRRSDSMQGQMRNNAEPYLRSMMLIIEKHSLRISKFHKLFYRNYILFQTFRPLKLNFRPNLDISVVREYFTLPKNKFQIYLVYFAKFVFLVTPYYAYRLVVKVR